MPETLITPEIQNFIPCASALGILFFALAFSRKTRRAIWKRDEGKSRWSGKTEDLECAHIDHDRSKPNYDDPSNGRLLTIGEHFWDHINREGRNGLDKNSNDWAIWQLWKRFWGVDK